MSSRNFSDASRCVVIALGDPAGIGMEVVLKALADPTLPTSLNPLLVGCRSSLTKTHQRLQEQSDGPLANPADLWIDDQPLKTPVAPGQPTVEGAAAGFHWLSRAVELLQEHHGRALVTAPIAKHLWHAAGHRYPGQTERLAERRIHRSSMLFTAISPHSGWRLNTLLTTTHTLGRRTHPHAEHKLKVLLHFCERFNPHPHLVVAGLNPHAGEAGKLGTEEIDWLNPC